MVAVADICLIAVSLADIGFLSGSFLCRRGVRMKFVFCVVLCKPAKASNFVLSKAHKYPSGKPASILTGLPAFLPLDLRDVKKYTVQLIHKKWVKFKRGL